jgi:hypothetical protein
VPRTGVIALSAASTLLAVAAAPAPAATLRAPGAALRAPGDTSPLHGDELLSNEKTVTRWVNPVSRAQIRVAPFTHARAFDHLHLLTEDGRPEVYLALESHVDGLNRVWIHLRVPGRPNGRTGWVLEQSLSELHVVRTKLRINRRTLKATLFKDGNIEWQAPIGVGKASTPTPPGRFWVRELLRNLGGGGLYGPWAFGTADYSVLSDWPGGGVIGIHGTNEPQLIPGRPSHGCIRMRNANISRLAKIMPLGTPVEIL